MKINAYLTYSHKLIATHDLNPVSNQFFELISMEFKFFMNSI